MRRVRVIGLLAALAALLAFPSAGLAANPGPPNVFVLAPVAVFTEPQAPPVFEPGLIVITFADRVISCESNPGPPDAPPNPCQKTTR